MRRNRKSKSIRTAEYCLGEVCNLKVTPRLDDLGNFGFEFQPDKHPVKKPCHVHLRWAKESCPKCGSALMMYYAPTVKHRAGKPAVTSEEAHPIVFVSCVNCGIYSMTKGSSIIIDEPQKP